MGNQTSQPAALTSDQLSQAHWTRGADVEIVCSGGLSVKAHSLVLSWASPDVLAEWHRLKTEELGESQGRCTLEALQDTAEAWQAALLFMYPVLPRPTLTLQQAHKLLPVADKYAMPHVMEAVGRCVFQNSHQLSTKSGEASYKQLEAWASVGGRWGLVPMLQACATQAERLGMRTAEIAQMVEQANSALLLKAFQGVAARRLDKDHTLPVLLQLLKATHVHNVPGRLQDTAMRMLLSYGAAIDVVRAGEDVQQLLAGLPDAVQAQLLLRWLQVAAGESGMCHGLDAAGHPLVPAAAAPGTSGAAKPAASGSQNGGHRAAENGASSGPHSSGMSTLHFSLQVMTAPELQEPGPNRDACIAKLCSADCTTAALTSAHTLGSLLEPVPPALQVPVLRAWLKAGSSKVSSLMLWGKRLFADYGGALPADRSNMGSGSGFASAASCPALPESEEQAALARFQRGADVELVCSGGEAVPAHAQALMWASEELGQLVSRSWLAQGDTPGATPVDVSEDEADAWQAALVSLYPVLSRPMDLARAQRVVALAHKHGMRGVLGEVEVCLAACSAQLSHDTSSTPPHAQLLWWTVLSLTLGLRGVAATCKARLQQLPLPQLAALLADDGWQGVGPDDLSELDSMVAKKVRGLGQSEPDGPAGASPNTASTALLAALLTLLAAADKHGLELLGEQLLLELRGPGAVAMATRAARTGELWGALAPVQSDRHRCQVVEGWLSEAGAAVAMLQRRLDSAVREHAEVVARLQKQAADAAKAHEEELTRLRRQVDAAKAAAKAAAAAVAVR